MPLRLSDVLPLLAICIGVAISHVAGIGGVTSAFFALSAVAATGYVAGRGMMPGASKILATFWGSVAAVSVLMLLRGVWFYAGGTFGGWGDVFTTIGMVAITTGVAGGIALVSGLSTHPRNQAVHHSHERSALRTFIEATAGAVSLCGFLLIAYVAWHAGTTEAIRTPWPLLPNWVLPMVGLLWALTLANAWRQGSGLVIGVQAACAIGATVVIAPLLYKIGFGFDGFLHVAGESVLAKTGTLSPAPPYYMGQYLFVTWIAQMFDLSVATVDRWAVATMATILIPAAALLGRRIKTMLPALVLIPIAPLVTTTPHGFATALAIAALLSYPQARIATIDEQDDDAPIPGVIIALLLAAWSALAHPLVGLPVFGAIIAALLWRVRHWVRYPLSLLAAIGAGISVPLVFGLASSLGSSAGVGFSLSAVMDTHAWKEALASFLPWVPNRYAAWAQASVWIEKLIPWTVIALVCVAIGRRMMAMLRNDANQQQSANAPGAHGSHPSSTDGIFILASASTFVAALAMHLAGDFHFLIDYERGNYTERLFLVALLLLLPVAMPTFAWLLEKAKHGAIPSVAGVILAVALLGAGATYAALPRHDALTPSRGWSVSAADVEAVRLIDRDAAGESYTVLANQSVSAAAVREFGFARYHNDVFFYPIPTGGPLYDLFLRASYEDPGRATMTDAATLGGSQRVYLVVNDYWWQADELSERAAAEADRAFTVDEGTVKIFMYRIER